MEKKIFLSSILCALAAACSAGDGGRGGSTTGDGVKDGSSSSGGDPSGFDAPMYATLADLHERAMATTCSLNNGVCHNSKEYPDLHTVPNLVAAMGKPCNVAATAHEDVNDACEPEGDHLIVPSAGVDAEIAHVEIEPADAATADIESVRIWFATKLVTSPAIGASDIEVHRGDTVFHLGKISYYGPATVASADADSVTLDVGQTHASIKEFLDDRVYPWDDLMIRVGDPNEDGVLGHANALRLIEPGDPMKSYLVLRLIDESYGDLMPRQCRTWDDQATWALGCWIEGLVVDDTGQPTNADAPIDYDHCDFQPKGLGKCGTGEGPGGIFTTSCGGAKCHVGDPNPAAGLDLSDGKWRASLVDVPSTQVPAKKRVVPGNPDESYLLCKLAGECAERVGAQMPSGLPALPADRIEIIRAWIAAGAK